ncbi:NPCBM/NEW2 domain-containing protein [Nonomuraea sp. NPDC049152]|uniref:NPCBM/NEW2 domain-containing protein n=1 Tax=Nonomuraea sp. NPDC049152 TaxID=3154350 RepID=UPI0033F0F041
MRRLACWLASVVVAALCTVAMPGTAHAATLDSITAFTAENDVYTMEAGTARLRLTFQKDDVFRLELAPDGTFTDPANTGAGAKIIVKSDYPRVPSSWKEFDDRYEVTTGAVTVRVGKKPVLFSVLRADGSLVWAESAPLAWDAEGTRQTLTPGQVAGGKEQYFGGGMQNGRLNHTGTTIRITRDFDWDDGGNPNAAPYYMSTAGYGVLRNTFAPGGYAFTSPAVLSHAEQRFDAYYFVAAKPYDLKSPLDRYTELTGRPMMPPIYGMEMGDADCYNRSSPTYTGPKDPAKWTTPSAVKVAEGYVANDMPRGWMLVNDGYGCEYQQLKETGDALRERGIQMGLWTQRALDSQEYEVRQAGVRVRKLDVAWIGPGYRHALTECEGARDGIEKYSDARGFVWMVEGWAGSQRCAVQWTGDHSGSLDAIRWQIPAITGAGLTGMPFTAGDIDGIFGGSAESYVRDLQWKAFTPALMSMSGWADKDKQPWTRGEPYTSINRKFLKLRERLLPYLYTYAAEAHRTGAPVNRALVLEYPSDRAAWQVQDEFLAGRDLLVAPVYTGGDVRNGIYLPQGRWVDYWSGKVYDGPRTIDGYHAPLERLPLFVRAGAIVPMYRDGINNHSEVGPDDPLTLDVYPLGDSSFDLYSDDGKTRAYDGGQSATQKFTVDAPSSGLGVVKIGIGPISGSYTGKPAARPYELNVHTGRAPTAVLYGKRPLAKVTKAAYDGGATGWYADGDLVKARVPALAASASAELELIGAGVVGGLFPGDGDATVTSVVPAMLTPGGTVEVPVTFANRTGLPARDVRLALQVPAGWTAPSPRQAKIVLNGKSFDGKLSLTVPDDAQPGPATLIASATYRVHADQREVTSAAASKVPHKSLAAAFDNVGISDDADVAKGNIDGGGSSFSRQRLAAAGLTPGVAVQVQGAPFTWPDTEPGHPDNVSGHAQTFALAGQGNTLAFLGTGTSGSAAGALTVHYADGSAEQRSLGFANWCCLDPAAYGSKIAFSTRGKNTAAGPNQFPNVDYRVFHNAVRINPAKRVVAVTMPDNGAVHVFAATVTSVALPSAPKGEVWASDHPWLSATNGWGPVEKDRSNNDSAAGDGSPISLGGTVHPKGLGAHARSVVSYYTGGGCSAFTATVGVDDEIPGYGSVVFAVIADGKEVFRSATLTGTSAPVTTNASLAGAQYVDLVVEDAGDGNAGDHADWASARFIC